MHLIAVDAAFSVHHPSAMQMAYSGVVVQMDFCIILIVMCILHILFKSLANWIDRLEAKPHIWIWHRRLCLFKLIAAAAAPLWLCTRSQVLLPAQWLGHRCSCSRTQRIYSWWLRVCDCRGKMRAPACHGWPPTTIRICADCPFGGAAGVE